MANQYHEVVVSKCFQTSTSNSDDWGYASYIINNKQTGWDIVYSTVTSNSAVWEPGAGVLGGAVFQSTSALILGDLTTIASNSATWQSPYTAGVGDNSVVGGTNNNAIGKNSFIANGADNCATHDNSAIIGTSINSVSAGMLHVNMLYAKNLPKTNPGVPGVIWNDNGTLKIS